MSDTPRYLNAMGITPWVLRDPPRDPNLETVKAAKPPKSAALPELATNPEPAAPPELATNPEPAASPESIAPVPEWLIQASDQPVAGMVVAWPDRSLRLDDGGEAALILSKIIKAMGFGLDRFQVLGWAQGDRRPSVEHPTVFCFSDNPELMHPDWVALPSLARMIAEGPAAKGPAWAILKRWIGRL